MEYNPDLFQTVIITRKLQAHISTISDNIERILGRKLVVLLSGKCIKEGYVPRNPDKIKLLSYSAALIQGELLEFDVCVECEVCFPYEDLILNKCRVKETSAAGIRAEIRIRRADADDDDDEADADAEDEEDDDAEVPIVVFIQGNQEKSKPGKLINVKVIDKRFTVNDKFITVIAEIVEA